MKKRLTALTLVLLLLLGLLPTAWASWDSFRGDPSNMAITDAPTPTADSVELKWARKLGGGAWPNTVYVGVPILTDNALIVTVGTALYKLDPATGEVVDTGTLSASAGYANAAPAYADDKLFCALDGGVVEALDAETLESLWTYTDPRGGQNQVPVLYTDGRVLTGFWSDETETCNYVCLNATDGEAVWTCPNEGGYYWAGAVAVGDAVIFGGDNGKGTKEPEAVSAVCSVNLDTGDVISTLEVPGDQRSSIAYSADEGHIYFTTKAGYLCSAAVDETTGALSDLKTRALGSATTSTPVVYGGRVYLTAANKGSGASAVKQNFICADADTLEVLYTLPMTAYPQCSLLLSTAYLADTGKLCFYSTYNAKPGGITLIEAAPNGASGTVTELYDAAGYEEYCICSLICGADGTLYYKNDSGNLLAVGKAASDTMTVTVGAYDYNAVAAGLTGASESGVIFEETVTVPAGTSAADTVTAAAQAAGQQVTIEDGSWGPYLTAVNALVSGTGGGYSGWTLVHNGAFPSVGLGSLTLADGDSLSLHYSVNPDTVTDDVGSGEGLPTLTSFTLSGVTADMKKETTYDENWTPSTAYLIKIGEDWAALEGEGTEASPFVIPLTLPAGTKLTALTGTYTTQLGEHYRTVTGLEGKRDYTGGLVFALSSVYGGKTTWYKVAATVKSAASSTPTTGGKPAETPKEPEQPTETPTETPTEPAKVFSDVPQGHWARDAVDFVTAKGLFTGTSEDEFSPAATTTRGMVMTVLARLAGEDTSGGESWYEKGMTWAKQMDISDGAAPEEVITREQLAVMLYRYAKAEHTAAAADFGDVDAVSPWAAEAVGWCAEKGILTGKPGGLLDPQGTATRAEVAVMLARFVKAMEA